MNILITINIKHFLAGITFVALGVRVGRLGAATLSVRIDCLGVDWGLMPSQITTWHNILASTLSMF